MELTIDQAMQQGIAAQREGKLQDAERLYQAILKAQPLHTDANHNLGVIAASVNKVGLSLTLFKTALEANPQIEQFWLSYIDALIKGNQLETAKNVLAEGKKIGLAKDKVDALEFQIKQIMAPKFSEKKKSLVLKEKRKKITESKQQKKQAKGSLVNNMSPSQAQLNILLENYQSGRYYEAETLALLITQQFPEHQFGWKVLAAVFNQTDRVSQSLAANQVAVQLAPQDAEAHSNLGNRLNDLGRFEEAEAHCRRAIALKLDYTEAYSNLGITLTELGRFEEAEAHFRQAIALKSDFAEAHSNLGNVLKKLGRFIESQASCRQAIEFKPEYAEAHNNLGITLQEIGKLEETEASYRQAIKLMPDFAEAQNNLGVTLQELGRLDEAEASFRQAIVLKTNFAEAILNLSIVLDYMNNLEESVLQLEYLLEIDVDNLGLRAAVILAIHRFLEGNSVGSKELLLKSQNIQGKTTLEFNNDKNYHTFLLSILSWHENTSSISIKHAPNKKLYVIGESHSLISHGLRVQSAGKDLLCQSFLIPGCKQSDLGSNLKNQYKNKFKGIFCSLPKSSEILLAIGEIDCRLDSGIIKHKNKHPEKNMVELIKNTVENYIHYILKLNPDHGHNIIIQGVPCPNIDTKDIPTKKVLELIDVIREFNAVLKNKCNKVGFGFLDVHKLTNNGNGFSNSIWHLDANHLSPDGMHKAWLEHATNKSN